MRLFRDVDYFLYFEDFPRIGVPGAIWENADGTCGICINTLYCPRKQEEALRHELRHLVLCHLYRDDLELAEKEKEADDICSADVIYASDFSWVESL